MFNATNKIKQYTITLEHIYSRLVKRYIYDTFILCLDDPSKIAKWRITTACNLFASAQGAIENLPFDYPQLSPNDLFKLSSEIFNEQMDNTAITSLDLQDAQNDNKPSQIIEDIDRQFCNNVRNEIVLSLGYNVTKRTKPGAFILHNGDLRKNENAIIGELNKPLGDFSLLW